MSEIAEFTRHLGHYLPPPDVALVERAFAFSEHAHQGQFRKSGEPYITHPLAVASILSQWRLDAQGLAAALLHDVMEDTNVTKTEIESSFGKPVADMVDGVSKLDQIEFQSREDLQAEIAQRLSGFEPAPEPPISGVEVPPAVDDRLSSLSGLFAPGPAANAPAQPASAPQAQEAKPKENDWWRAPGGGSASAAAGSPSS